MLWASTGIVPNTVLQEHIMSANNDHATPVVTIREVSGLKIASARPLNWGDIDAGLKIVDQGRTGVVVQVNIPGYELIANEDHRGWQSREPQSTIRVDLPFPATIGNRTKNLDEVIAKAVDKAIHNHEVPGGFSQELVDKLTKKINRQVELFNERAVDALNQFIADAANRFDETEFAPERHLVAALNIEHAAIKARLKAAKDALHSAARAEVISFMAENDLFGLISKEEAEKIPRKSSMFGL
jgi:hypothetical protein